MKKASFSRFYIAGGLLTLASLSIFLWMIRILASPAAKELIDQGYQDYATEAAIAKVFGTEAVWRASDEALQIAAGSGYMRELPYERAMRDARILRIFEGTNEILRLFIALNAMNDVGAQLKELAQSVRGVLADPIKGFGVLSDYALKQATIRTGLVGEKRGWSLLHPALHDQAEQFEEETRELAWVADRVLRRHGRAIIDKQFALRRIADILIDLFVLASVMSRVNAVVEDRGEHEASRTRPVFPCTSSRGASGSP